MGKAHAPNKTTLEAVVLVTCSIGAAGLVTHFSVVTGLWNKLTSAARCLSFMLAWNIV